MNLEVKIYQARLARLPRPGSAGGGGQTGRVVDPDPDPVFLHGSGSGFQISLDPDLDLVSAQILENCRKVSKSDL